MKLTNKKILIGISISLVLGFTGLYMSNKKETLTPKNKLGEIKIEDDTKKESKDLSMTEKNEKTYTEQDSIGNQYKKVGLINEGIMFDIPKGFTGEYRNGVYYVYPSKNDNRNFSAMFAFRFSKNAQWERLKPEDAKDRLMDGSKNAIKYINHELPKPLDMTHLNRGKAKKMGDSLIYEIAKTSKYVYPDDPTKIFDMYTSFTYIPLLNTNVEVTAVSPFESSSMTDEIQSNIVSSISEYNPLKYKNKKTLDKVYKTKDVEAKLSSKYESVREVDNALLADISTDIFSKDYDMRLTIGKFKKVVTDEEKKYNIKYDPSVTSTNLFKYIYLSWFDFKSTSERSTVLDIPNSEDVKLKSVDNKTAYLHDFKLVAEHDVNAIVTEVLNPCRVTAYVVKIKDDEYGYIALRHSEYNSDIAKVILSDIALNTKFK